MENAKTAPILKGELDTLLEPLESAVIQLTSAMIDLTDIAKNKSSDPVVKELGESAWSLLEEVIDNLKKFRANKARILSLEEPVDE